MPFSQDLDNACVMEEDTKLAQVSWPSTICKACTSIFCCCHGLQTQTGNHGRMGKGPRYTQLV